MMMDAKRKAEIKEYWQKPTDDPEDFPESWSEWEHRMGDEEDKSREDIFELLAYTDKLEDELLEATTAAKEVTRLAAENAKFREANENFFAEHKRVLAEKAELRLALHKIGGFIVANKTENGLVATEEILDIVLEALRGEV